MDIDIKKWSLLRKIVWKNIKEYYSPFSSDFGSNLKDYQKSMEKLLNLNADILCEGHYGIIKSANEVERFIRSHKQINLK